MSRSTAEWIGKNDDTAIPPRVRLRVFRKADGKCQECGVEIVGKRWICDHRIALVNGGENRESNLGPIHEACNKGKTAEDVKEKAAVYRKAARNVGIKQFYPDDERARRRKLFSRHARREASASQILADLAGIDSECAATLSQDDYRTENSDV